MDSSPVNRNTRKSTKPQKTESTAPDVSIDNPPQRKQSKPSQHEAIETRSKEVQHWTTTSRKSAAWSDNSSYLESDDSCDNSRLQIAWDADNNETQSNHSEGSETSGTSSSNNDIYAYAHLKSAIEERSLKRWKDAITLDGAKLPLTYHKSMARQYPQKNRTPEQTEMRRRNTEAARISRAKQKMAELMMEKEASEQSAANTAIKRMIAAQLVYANKLRKLLDMPSAELTVLKRVGYKNSGDV